MNTNRISRGAQVIQTRRPSIGFNRQQSTPGGLPNQFEPLPSPSALINPQLQLGVVRRNRGRTASAVSRLLTVSSSFLETVEAVGIGPYCAYTPLNRGVKERLPNRNYSDDPRGKQCPGFTLIELITIFAVLALLSILLVPALTKTRPSAQASRCLNNLRQLGVAWRLYADDNAGRLVWNRDGANAGLSSSQNWVAGWLDFSSATDNTNTAMLIDHARYPFGAFLGPYVKSAGVFKCPADASSVRVGSLERLPRVRSVSMNNCVGEADRSWSTPSQYQLYRKIDTIGRPTPAALWIFLDEREDSINDGCFFSNPDTAYNLIDYPAAYHNRAAGFAFADGHSEIHHWTDLRTTPIVAAGQILQFNTILPGDLDVTWLQQHASSKP